MLADEFLSPLPLYDLLDQRPSTARGLPAARRTLLQSPPSPSDSQPNIEERHQTEQPTQPLPAGEQIEHRPTSPRGGPPPVVISPLVMVVDAFTNTNAAQNCRLPRFWKECPALWFLQAEVAFQLHRIDADETRYNIVVSMLDTEVSDLIQSPRRRTNMEDLRWPF